MTDQDVPQKEMPQYQSHKKVWALKIEAVEHVGEGEGDPGWQLAIADEGFAPVPTNKAWIDRHLPEAGGYYVVYEDGYASYSPKEAFEKGYTRMEGAE